MICTNCLTEITDGDMYAYSKGGKGIIHQPACPDVIISGDLDIGPDTTNYAFVLGRVKNLLVTAMVFIVALIGTGCGGRPQEKSEFVNETPQTTAFLEQTWQAAQTSLSHRVDMNPATVYLQGVPSDVREGDPKALQVKPDGLVVRSVLDENGLIPCPAVGTQTCIIDKAIAWSSYTPRMVSYAANLDAQPARLRFYVQYEMETQIMRRLGYDTGGR